MKDLEFYLEKYDIENIDDFVPQFYIMNLKNGIAIQDKAIKNLFSRYSKEDLIKIENYDEIGIVELVADGCYHIEDNKIIVEDYYG